MSDNLGTREQGRENDIFGLRLIGLFGWLRAAELARFLWPDSASASKNMSKLLGKWEREHYVIKRKLPENAGTALVLASGGVARLREAGYSAKSGKDWGALTADGFRPPSMWKHDLLTAGLAAYLSANFDVPFLTELEVQQRLAGQVANKLPDLLLGSNKEADNRLESGPFVWVEVESARKSGLRYTRKGYLSQDGHLLRLAKALVSSARGEMPALAGFEINGAWVAYDKDARDERGYAIDHRNRLLRALRNVKSVTVITFAEMTLKGGTVVDVKLDTVTLKPTQEPTQEAQ